MNELSRFFGYSLILTLIMQCGLSSYAKPHIMPPDIIGDDAKKTGSRTTSQQVNSPEYFIWMRSQPPKKIDAPIDPVTAAFFPQESKLSNVLKRRYYFHLSAMGEKSFSTLSKKDTVYRFLWVRSFHHPICVSIQILNHGNGGAVLHAVELEGGDMYNAPKGRQLRNFSVRYFPKLAKELIEKINTTGFWTLPLNDDVPNHVVDDGAQWVLEGWDNGKYRLVRRTSPREGKFRELCVSFLLLAHLYPSNQKEIY